VGKKQKLGEELGKTVGFFLVREKFYFPFYQQLL